MMVTVIGRGHSGTRAISHTLTQSGFFMGGEINSSGDLVPPESMYEACRVFGSYVKYNGNMSWDFSKVLEMEPTAEFVSLIEDYLSTVLNSDAADKGWKIPETTLVYPWIIKMFPDIHYIHWVRDPRDCILAAHVTDDLNDFNIEYDNTDDVRYRRAISWTYQRKLMDATPAPKNMLAVRFEDMVFNQDETLARLEKFLDRSLVKIEMRKDSVGRYKKDMDNSMFDFLKPELEKWGYTD